MNSRSAAGILGQIRIEVVQKNVTIPHARGDSCKCSDNDRELT